MTSPDAGDVLVVVGGPAGTAADVAAMQAAASDLVGVAGTLGEAGARAARAAADPDLAGGALLDPGGLVRAQAELVPAVAELAVLAARVGRLGAALGAAAAGYELAERGLRAVAVQARDQVAHAAGAGVLRVLPRLGPYGVLAAGTPAAAWLAVRAFPALRQEGALAARDLTGGRLHPGSLDDRLRRLGRSQADALAGDVRRLGAAAMGWGVDHPQATEHLLGAVPAFLDGLTGPLWFPVPAEAPGGVGTWPPADVSELALLLTAVGQAGSVLAPERGVVVRPTGPPRSVAAPDGVRQLLGRAVAYSVPSGGPPAGYVPGRLRVDRVDAAGGTRWVVTLPPTQGWGLGTGPNPFDGSSNLRAMAGQPGAASQAAVQAMAAAGVAPGEPVLLVGYSQGGLTALQLAGDPAVRERVEVTTVLTAGAPVGGYEPPDGVQLLSLEHEQDLVVTLDGRSNPDDPAWTTVRRDLVSGAAADPSVRSALPGRPSTGHDLAGYLRTAALTDASSEESVQAWLRHAAPFLRAPGTRVTTTEYDVARVLP